MFDGSPKAPSRRGLGGEPWALLEPPLGGGAGELRVMVTVG